MIVVIITRILFKVVIGLAGSRAMGWGILGPGPVLDACALLVPIMPKVCTSCQTNTRG